MIRNIELGFKVDDFQRAHDVPFFDASRAVFGGLQILLDAQTPAKRRPPPSRGFAHTPAWNPGTNRSLKF